MASSSFAQGNNTYIPSTESSGHLFINFSRNPKDFALNEYVQLVPVTKSVGRYIKMTVEEAGRILNTNDSDHLWEDGEDEPSHRGNLEKFAFETFSTQRRVFGYRVGQKAVDQADFDVLGVHGKIKAQQAMTSRTQRAITTLTTSGNYDSANTSAVSSISGNTGKWDVSTSARLDIKRSFRYAQNIIRTGTLGAIKIEDLMVVMNPDCAGLMAESQEIVDLIKQSPAAAEYIKGNFGKNAAYGLPDKLYGVKIVIEDAVKVTNRKGATKSTSYVLGATTPFMCARPGSLNGSNGDGDQGKDSNESPNFSTCTGFVYEDMTVETKNDQDNRVHKGRIVDDLGFVMTANISGFLFSSAVQ